MVELTIRLAFARLDQGAAAKKRFVLPTVGDRIRQLHLNKTDYHYWYVLLRNHMVCARVSSGCTTDLAGRAIAAKQVDVPKLFDAVLPSKVPPNTRVLKKTNFERSCQQTRKLTELKYCKLQACSLVKRSNQ